MTNQNSMNDDGIRIIDDPPWTLAPLNRERFNWSRPIRALKRRRLRLFIYKTVAVDACRRQGYTMKEAVDAIELGLKGSTKQ